MLRMPLWKLLGSEEEVAAAVSAPPPSNAFTTMGLEVQTLTQLGLVEEAAENVCLGRLYVCLMQNKFEEIFIYL